METRVVTPDTGIWIDGEDGGKKLREEEEKKRDIKRGSFENEFLLKDTFEKPKSGDDNGEEIYKEHLVKLKNLAGLRPEKKGSEEEEREEAETEDLINFVCFGHGNSLAFTEIWGRAIFKRRWRRELVCF